MSQTTLSQDSRKPMRGGELLCAMLLALCTTFAWAQGSTAPVILAEASTGLAFSEAEVDAYADTQRQQFLSERTAKMERGCATHCEQLARVWASLQPVVESQRTEAVAQPTLEVVVSPDVDALAFAQGTMVVSEAFMSRLDLNDAELAFVLAHEASHILLQHERQTLTSAMALMPGPGIHNAADCYTEIGARYFLLDTYFAMIAQQTEYEADEVGFNMAALAGFDPHQQLAFMEKLTRIGQSQSMLSTHPDPALRLGRLRQALPLAQRLYDLGRTAR